jgi:hypothetical protein
MPYLQPSEYSTYCTEFTVDDFHVLMASNLIDSFIGKTIGSTSFTEIVKLSKKFIGKLNHLPIVSVSEVKLVQVSPFGLTENDGNTESIYFTDTYGRFQYISGNSLGVQLWGNPNTLKITYNAGFSIIPEDIKIACGAIAQNISQAKNFSGVKEMSDLDLRVSMFDDSFLPSDIRMILSKYKQV